MDTEEDLIEMERRFNEANKEVKKRLALLEAARDKAAEERRGPLKALTIRAHEVFCGWNHTDGCSWGYEDSATDPWLCDAHLRWLRHVEKLVIGDKYTPAKVTADQYAALIDQSAQIKKIAPQALQLLRTGQVQP